MMQSRLVREGAVGLLILGGVVSFAGVFAWIYNLGPSNRGYRFVIEYADANGLAAGSTVQMRGVRIGRVQQITPGPAAVKVAVDIESPVLIPLQSEFATSQTGLVGETVIEITPQGGSNLPADLSPQSQNCADAKQIVCPNTEVKGTTDPGYSDLVTSLDNLVNRVNNDPFFENLNQALTSIDKATQSFETLSGTLNAKVNSINLEQLDLSAFTAAGRSVEKAADQLSQLVSANQLSLTASTRNIEQITANLKEISDSLKPLLTDPELQANVKASILNITTATDNAVAATQDLKELTTQINDPAIVASIRQTLDSARITFQNAQKISADIDDLTGDPQFRDNLRNLVKGLGNLVSTIPGSQLSTAPIAWDPAGSDLGVTYALAPQEWLLP